MGSILLRSSKAVVPAKAGTTVEASARILLESQQRSSLLEGALTRSRGDDRLPDFRSRRCRAAIPADLPQRQARLYDARHAQSSELHCHRQPVILVRTE